LIKREDLRGKRKKIERGISGKQWNIGWIMKTKGMKFLHEINCILIEFNYRQSKLCIK
jgi:hypothetical protein